MRIAVIGTGYVGLVSGACFSAFGVEVVCVDNDAAKIARLERGEMPIYEPGLEALVAENVGAGRLSFTTDLRAAVQGAEAVFIAVGTPSRRGDGHADLSHVFAAAEEIGRALDGYSVVVTKSTVPVGTGRRVAAILERVRPGARFDVAANPEFLREGSAIEDFMRPDRVVIGTDSERARAVLRALYRPLYLIETPMLFTTIETAELIKYAANAFLATKITFINEIADLCEAVGADVQDVAKGIGLDGRIGRKFLHAGPGFGGSCFPKDCRALVRTAREAQARLEIVETVVRVNEARKRAMADRIIAACGGSVAGKRLAVLGLTFKPNTDDRRRDPRLRPRRHGGGEKAAARTFLLRRSLRGDGGGRRSDPADRVERLPRPRPRACQKPAAHAARHRSAQHLRAAADDRGRARLCQYRAAGIRPDPPRAAGARLRKGKAMSSMAKRVLVTGGAGFLGSHLCERLIAQGDDVLCVDNYFTGRKDNVARLLQDPHFEAMRHDITFPLYVEVDEIYNLACPASPIHYQFDPVQTTKTSVIGAINMLGLAKRLKAKIFQASTSEVYGDPTVHPQSESYRGNVNPIGPRACYDEGKRCAETLFFDYYRQHKLRIRVARIFNTYGPRMHPNDGRVVSNFIVQALRNQPITLYGDGTQTRA